MRKMRVLACALVWAAAGCGADAQVGGGEECSAAAWRLVDGDMDRSGLAMWGAADDDLYLVGGPLGAAGMALLRHWDGKSWTEIETGTPETLWWVWGTKAGGRTDVWTVGENGTVLRYDGTRVNEVPSGTAAHLYGVWGTSSDDVWIVGGRPGPEEGPDDVLLHWNGRGLESVALPESRAAAFFKVWGASADEIFVTGERGTVWHGKGGSWVNESAQIDTFDTLATVHGCSASEVYTVGGQAVYRYDGARWSKLDEANLLGIAAGVACGADTVLVVGTGGLKMRLDKASGAWRNETLEEPYNTDFHGAWISPGGTPWATGGNYIAPASQIDRRIGVIARYGCD
jgi:hypothetical protein